MSSACYYFELEDFGILGLIIDGPDWLLDLNRRRLAAENFDWLNILIGQLNCTFSDSSIYKSHCCPLVGDLYKLKKVHTSSSLNLHKSGNNDLVRWDRLTDMN